MKKYLLPIVYFIFSPVWFEEEFGFYVHNEDLRRLVPIPSIVLVYHHRSRGCNAVWYGVKARTLFRPRVAELLSILTERLHTLSLTNIKKTI